MSAYVRFKHDTKSADEVDAMSRDEIREAFDRGGGALLRGRRGIDSRLLDSGCCVPR